MCGQCRLQQCIKCMPEEGVIICATSRYLKKNSRRLENKRCLVRQTRLTAVEGIAWAVQSRNQSKNRIVLTTNWARKWVEVLQWRTASSHRRMHASTVTRGGQHRDSSRIHLVLAVPSHPSTGGNLQTNGVNGSNNKPDHH